MTPLDSDLQVHCEQILNDLQPFLLLDTNDREAVLFLVPEIVACTHNSVHTGTHRLPWRRDFPVSVDFLHKVPQRSTGFCLYLTWNFVRFPVMFEQEVHRSFEAAASDLVYLGRRLILSNLVYLGQRLIVPLSQTILSREARKFACRSRPPRSSTSGSNSAESRAGFLSFTPLHSFDVVVVVGAAADEVMTHFTFKFEYLQPI